MPQSNSLPYPEEFERMVYAREVEPSYSAIARKFGVSRAWASKYYNKHGVDIQKLKRDRQIRLSKDNCLACIYNDFNIKDSAKVYGVTPSAYKRSLKEHGLTQAKRLDIVRELHRRQAVSEYIYYSNCELGHLASSHELKQAKKHKLYGRIYRLFGSFVEFRKRVDEVSNG